MFSSQIGSSQPTHPSALPTQALKVMIFSPPHPFLLMKLISVLHTKITIMAFYFKLIVPIDANLVSFFS